MFTPTAGMAATLVIYGRSHPEISNLEVKVTVNGTVLPGVFGVSHAWSTLMVPIPAMALRSGANAVSLQFSDGVVEPKNPGPRDVERHLSMAISRIELLRGMDADGLLDPVELLMYGGGFSLAADAGGQAFAAIGDRGATLAVPMFEAKRAAVLHVEVDAPSAAELSVGVGQGAPRTVRVVQGHSVVTIALGDLPAGPSTITFSRSEVSLQIRRVRIAAAGEAFH